MMIIGVDEKKNRYLEFSSGKKIKLSEEEFEEFKNKIRMVFAERKLLQEAGKLHPLIDL